MTSIAIVTRINEIELPYIGSFISHYNSIGVTRFYRDDKNFIYELYKMILKILIIKNNL